MQFRVSLWAHFLLDFVFSEIVQRPGIGGGGEIARGTFEVALGGKREKNFFFVFTPKARTHKVQSMWGLFLQKLSWFKG